VSAATAFGTTTIILQFNLDRDIDVLMHRTKARPLATGAASPGGALVLHMSYPGPAYWSEPEGKAVLEHHCCAKQGNGASGIPRGKCDFRSKRVARDRGKRLGGVDAAPDVEQVPGDLDGLRWRTRATYAVDDQGRGRAGGVALARM
jgi:hypothetical protein